MPDAPDSSSLCRGFPSWSPHVGPQMWTGPPALPPTLPFSTPSSRRAHSFLRLPQRVPWRFRGHRRFCQARVPMAAPPRGCSPPPGTRPADPPLLPGLRARWALARQAPPTIPPCPTLQPPVPGPQPPGALSRLIAFANTVPASPTSCPTACSLRVPTPPPSTRPTAEAPAATPHPTCVGEPPAVPSPGQAPRPVTRPEPSLSGCAGRDAGGPHRRDSMNRGVILLGAPRAWHTRTHSGSRVQG